MTTSSKPQLLLTIGLMIAGLVAIGGAIGFYWLPRLTATGNQIRQQEATIAAIQRQQENLIGINQQLDARRSDQERLNTEVWAFSKEDHFFELWDTIGDNHQTSVELETIADAAPGSAPVQREARVTMNGSLTNIFSTLDAIAALTPAVILRELSIQPDDPSNVRADLIVTTLWYDDTLR